ncbi:peptide-methionine (S)-S-oxide reductase MsrA [Dechloromonas sp. XY25]|uniref:Peptide methionine sulfoxide reductase MsrA n=1 Tax=Dechloromonas hankyongensis TaxID=2908002 RepID=A0ABS9JZZ5_9RHOO|nr:peptide-methionine (S)-S-oxide reductase MsrA [Dechloromonas hankyongensis]MCG2576483.1 peptide-methionine (S)-S-oxide reductase MsrA [Dechloromonas hankyongensis]
MPQPKLAVATLAGGCFWCLEAAFEQLDGVISVLPGYMGGQLPRPNYEAVCRGDSGHAEVVQIRFDPAIIDYDTLLTAFFTIHDPTTLNRQGHDVGSQYRSAIFYHNDAQKAAAEAMVARLNAEGLWADPIVTEVTPATTFFEAEEYHHQYFRRNPYQGYCMAVVGPKAAKLRHAFADRLKAE